MNVSKRYGMPLGPPQHVLDATQDLQQHRLATKLWSSADDDRRRADVLVDGSYSRAAGVARIGLWRSHQAFYGTFYGVFYGTPAPNYCPCPLGRSGPFCHTYICSVLPSAQRFVSP